MADKYLINTGEPRSITGHVVSGALASGIISSTVNYKKYQNGDINYVDAIQNTTKITMQGGIATGAAISATNHLGPAGGGLFKALTAISIGMAGIYAVEVADQLLSHKLSEKAEEVDHNDESIIVSGE